MRSYDKTTEKKTTKKQYSVNGYTSTVYVYGNDDWY